MFYLGKFNGDTKLFNKNVGESIWNSLQQKCQVLDSDQSLKYYTFDRIITKNLKSGETTVEKPEIRLIHNIDSNFQAIEIDSEMYRVAIFPLQMEYFNKQVYHTDICQYKSSVILFSKYIEKGTTYYEICSKDLEALAQLSSSSSS